MTAYTGGVGAGKTCLATRQAIKCYKRALSSWKKERFKCKILRRELPKKPLLFSNVPIIYKKEFRSCKLTPEVVLLQQKIPQHSVIVVDEVSGFLNQFEYSKNGNVKLFDEFCRFVRQYIEGNCIINDQCSANVVLQIRRRLNTIYNLSKHRYFFGLTTVKVREINISDEIVAIDEKDTNEPYERFICFGNYFKWYQSRCYKNRYQVLPDVEPEYHDSLYTERLFVCPDMVFPNAIENALAGVDSVVMPSTGSTGSATTEGCGTVDDIFDLFED